MSVVKTFLCVVSPFAEHCVRLFLEVSLFSRRRRRQIRTTRQFIKEKGFNTCYEERLVNPLHHNIYCSFSRSSLTYVSLLWTAHSSRRKMTHLAVVKRGVYMLSKQRYWKHLMLTLLRRNIFLHASEMIFNRFASISEIPELSLSSLIKLQQWSVKPNACNKQNYQPHRSPL